MVTSRKRSVKNRSIPICVIYGTLVETMLSLLLSAVLAFLISDGKLKEEWISAGVLIILLFSSFFGCTTAVKVGKEPIAILSLMTAMVFALLLLGIAILLLDCTFGGVWIKLLAILAGAVCGCMTCIHNKKKRPSR